MPWQDLTSPSQRRRSSHLRRRSASLRRHSFLAQIHGLFVYHVLLFSDGDLFAVYSAYSSYNSAEASPMRVNFVLEGLLIIHECSLSYPLDIVYFIVGTPVVLARAIDVPFSTDRRDSWCVCRVLGNERLPYGFKEMNLHIRSVRIKG